MQADLTLSTDLVKNGPQQTIRAQRKRTNACKNYSSSSYVHNMMIIDQRFRVHSVMLWWQPLCISTLFVNLTPEAHTLFRCHFHWNHIGLSSPILLSVFNTFSPKCTWNHLPILLFNYCKNIDWRYWTICMHR